MSRRRQAVSQISQFGRHSVAGGEGAEVSQISQPGSRSAAPDQGAEDFAGTDRFLVQRRLGAGAFGVVYEAFDRQEQSLVALKVLRFAEADALYRFKKGFRSLADIRHPNLVSFYELLSQEGLWYFSMELVPGVDFVEAARDPAAAESSAAQVVPDPSAPDFDRIRGLVLQLARGLHALHRYGKVHRDIKPPNVLVTGGHTGEARTVLLDFGLVTELQRVGIPEAEPQTVGTPAYMSPEQALALPGSAASDWYSVGVMLYQALTGELPFSGTTLEILADKQTQAPPPPAGVPGDLEEICFGLLDPDPETRLQGAEVLRRLGERRPRTSTRPAAPPPAEVDPAFAGREVDPPFVGREKVLAELDTALAASRGGTVAVFLRGTSGMGKSALIERFVAGLAAADDQAVVLAGRCYLQESVPYKALDSLIDALSRYLASLSRRQVEELMPAEVGPLARLFPVLLRHEAIARAEIEELDPHHLRRRAFAGLRELLGRLAARRPLVLVIDDLHWGDLDSFRLLDEILKPPDPPCFLLIGAYRLEDEPASPFLRALAEHRAALRWRGVDVRELEIGALSAAEARDLIGALEPRGVAAPAGYTAGILREAGGNPLFLSELALFSRTESRIEPSGMAEVDLADVILSRIEALPPPARKLLEAVAVAGQPLALQVARQAAGSTPDGAAAVALLRTDKLIRQVAGDDGEEIETYHDRIRQTVVDCLSPRALRGYHHALALALESSGSGDPETLAIHFQATEEVARARQYAVAAAARAEQALAFERAARLYRQALELLDPRRRRDGDERYRLQVKLGEALANAGRSREAAEIFVQAAGHSGTINPIEAQRHAAEKLLISGHIDRGMSILRHVLRTLGMRLERRSWKALLDLWWRRLRLRLRGLEFEERSAADCDPQALQRIDACWSVEIGLCLVDVLRASQFHARHLLLALEAGEPERVARGLAMEVFFGSMEGTAAAEVLGRARRLSGRLSGRTSGRLSGHTSGRIGGRYPACLTEMAAGMLACSRGRWSEARRSLEKAEDQLREARTGVAWELDTVRHFRVLALLQMGRWPQLFAELPSLLAPAREQGDLYLEIHLRQWVESFRYLVEDRPEAARETLGETTLAGRRRAHPTGWSQEGFHYQHFGHLYASAQVALYQGRGAAAWEMTNRRWRALTNSMIQRIEMVLILSLDLRARCALAAAAEGDDPVRRRGGFGQAAVGAREVGGAGSSWPAALSGLLRAGIAAAQGHRESASAHLETAAGGFEMAGMPVHAGVARWRHRRLSGDDGVAERRVLESRGVEAPERLAAVFSPGPW